jgi:hypothetical protein
VTAAIDPTGASAVLAMLPRRAAEATRVGSRPRRKSPFAGFPRRTGDVDETSGQFDVFLDEVPPDLSTAAYIGPGNYEYSGLVIRDP